MWVTKVPLRKKGPKEKVVVAAFSQVVRLTGYLYHPPFHPLWDTGGTHSTFNNLYTRVYALIAF